MVIEQDHVQLTLDMDPGLAERYSSLKECVAAGVYRHGLKRAASKLFVYPGNLSVMLSGDGQRHFDLDLLEQYIEAFDDVTPILYLVRSTAATARPTSRTRCSGCSRCSSSCPACWMRRA